MLNGVTPGNRERVREEVDATLAESNVFQNGMARGVERLGDIISSGARSLEELRSAPPLLRARLAVLVLDGLADQFARYPNNSLARYCAHDGATIQAEYANDLQVIKSAFSLRSNSLMGYRESEPEFVLKYLLYRALLNGKLPVYSSDLKDTLSTFIHSKPFSELNPSEQHKARGLPRVPEKLEEAMSLGPVIIVTGDTHETIVDHFLKPNGWVIEKNGELCVNPSAAFARNLIWLPRTGMEKVQFDSRLDHFVRSPLVSGIRFDDIPLFQTLIEEVLQSEGAYEHFQQDGRNYAHQDGSPPGTLDIRQGIGRDDNSIACFPAGVLTRSARGRFEQDKENFFLLERLASELNKRFQREGLTYAVAKRGGLSTIDIVTSDKGKALTALNGSVLGARDFVVFTGDRVALTGNDFEATQVADVSIQVGPEFDRHFYPLGNRALLRTKQLAAQGGTAEFIGIVNGARRIGLSSILASQSKDSTIGTSQFTRFPMAVSRLASDIARQLTEGETEETETLKNSLAATLGQLPNLKPFVVEYPNEVFELTLLQRAIRGQAPVPACDIKDTLAVFGSGGCAWFP
ncbi:MAG: hypothetical protein KDD60_06050, partial [Bdellovibrionales bacterium]|nr:hypothetical protein [Bdellovibrionales bacterium]